MLLNLPNVGQSQLCCSHSSGSMCGWTLSGAGQHMYNTPLSWFSTVGWGKLSKWLPEVLLLRSVPRHPCHQHLSASHLLSTAESLAGLSTGSLPAP